MSVNIFLLPPQILTPHNHLQSQILGPCMLRNHGFCFCRGGLTLRSVQPQESPKRLPISPEKYLKIIEINTASFRCSLTSEPLRVFGKLKRIFAVRILIHQKTSLQTICFQDDSKTLQDAWDPDCRVFQLM